MKVKLLQEIRQDGKPVKANSVVELDEPLARSLIGAGRAEAMVEAEKPAKPASKKSAGSDGDKK